MLDAVLGNPGRVETRRAPSSAQATDVEHHCRELSNLRTDRCHFADHSSAPGTGRKGVASRTPWADRSNAVPWRSEGPRRGCTDDNYRVTRSPGTGGRAGR